MRKFLLILFIPFMLTACGGSDAGGNVINESAAGIWKGTGVSTDNESGEIVGLVASNGKAFFLTDLPAITYGNASVTGNKFSFSGTIYDGVNPPEIIKMFGTVASGKSINVDYSTTSESGSITLTKADRSVGVYDRPSDLAKLEGTWNDVVSDNEGTWVFTIKNNGAFSSIRASDNCSMTGSFNTIDSTKNEYSVTATISSCNELNGSYTGLGFTSDSNSLTDNVISFVITNSKNAGVFEVTKQ